MYLLTTVTAPTDEVVTLAEARSHLRFYDETDTSENAYIQSLIDAAVGNIDGPEGMLGRALVEQQIKLTLDQFPCLDDYGHAQRVKIPLPPLISVDSVKYTKTDGTEGTYADFRTFGIGAKFGGYIMPSLNSDWPTTACDPGAVRITFTAGYDAAAVWPAAGAIPPPVKHAIKLIVSHLYEHREENLDSGAKFGLLELPFGIQRLLNPLRVR